MHKQSFFGKPMSRNIFSFIKKQKNCYFWKSKETKVWKQEASGDEDTWEPVKTKELLGKWLSPIEWILSGNDCPFVTKTILTRIISEVCVPGLFSYQEKPSQTMMKSCEVLSWVGFLLCSLGCRHLMTAPFHFWEGWREPFLSGYLKPISSQIYQNII